ncbi:glycosyltransferase family 39 protein [candidate division KSB1 bacterium]
MIKLKALWKLKPLWLIIGAAILTRLLAVIFSKGFGMHDDHFLVIEVANSWANGTDYNNWLPGSNINNSPQGHSFFYVGFHYLLFLFLNLFSGIIPELKMFIVRIIHATLSLLIIYFGYKITEQIADKKTASKAGLLLAVFWFMPFLAVRNLVEFVCIPFLIWGTFLIIKNKINGRTRFYLIAGILFGLAFSIRFQSILYTGGVGLVLLIQYRWKQTLFFLLGLIASISLIQGGIDLMVWGTPFAEFIAYSIYNYNHATDYIVTGWYSYILFILGILIPPLSFLLLWGFIRKWRDQLIIFLPVVIFLIFHSIFPNKQERFILTIIPFFIILGTAGWMDFINKSSFWSKNIKLHQVIWIFFWVINITLLSIASTTYSKRARVESMKYLSKFDQIKSIIIEDTNNESTKYPPGFYLDKRIQVFESSARNPIDSIYTPFGKDNYPDFILFTGRDHLEKRVKLAEGALGGLIYETTIYPGFLDKIMHRLNPLNANETIYIYRIKQP